MPTRGFHLWFLTVRIGGSAERSQHLTQADKTVFGQSYTADTSSCDGLSAFLREKPDHRAVEHFQGLTQFRHDCLPTRLPAALKDEVGHNSEIVEWDRKIAQTSDAQTRPSRHLPLLTCPHKRSCAGACYQALE